MQIMFIDQSLLKRTGYKYTNGTAEFLTHSHYLVSV